MIKISFSSKLQNPAHLVFLEKITFLSRHIKWVCKAVDKIAFSGLPIPNRTINKHNTIIQHFEVHFCQLLLYNKNNNKFLSRVLSFRLDLGLNNPSDNKIEFKHALVNLFSSSFFFSVFYCLLFSVSSAHYLPNKIDKKAANRCFVLLFIENQIRSNWNNSTTQKCIATITIIKCAALRRGTLSIPNMRSADQWRKCITITYWVMKCKPNIGNQKWLRLSLCGSTEYLDLLNAHTIYCFDKLFCLHSFKSIK